MDFIKTRAAVAWAPKQPLVIEELDLMPPQKGEVLVRIVASGVCHTDAYTLDGLDAEGVFPCVLGHEGAGIVVAVGEGVSSVKPGDHVIPLYTAECGECEMCTSGKTNLCSAVRATQGKGLMPDGTVRFFKDGQPIYHYMGCSTFSEYTVVAEVSLAKIQPEADLHEICLLGCGVTTGMGAVIKTAKVQAGDSVAIFGLGGIGLAAVIGARMVGAGRIIGIDTNPDKFAMARKLLLRVHRQRGRDAFCARMLPQRLGRIRHHRRRPGGRGNPHAAVPARYRPCLARLGLRRCQRAQRTARHRAAIPRRQIRPQRLHHHHHAA